MVYIIYYYLEMLLFIYSLFHNNYLLMINKCFLIIFITILNAYFY